MSQAVDWSTIQFLSINGELLTSKSLSEALLFAEHGQSMLCTEIVLNVRNNFCTQHVLPRFELEIVMHLACYSMNNLWWYCGLVDAKIRASDKDLSVLRCATNQWLLYRRDIQFLNFFGGATNQALLLNETCFPEILEIN